MSMTVSSTAAERAIAVAGLPKAEIIYPESDGKPMAENTRQYRWLTRIKGGLDARFEHDPLVFVAGDLLWYPVEHAPDINTAPDVMVVVGRPKGERGSYKQWEEADIAPQVVFEIWSPGNRKPEKEKKLVWYEDYGVDEYYTYDPDRDEMKGWLRHGHGFAPIAPMDGWRSPCLDVTFRRPNGRWNLHHPDGEPFEDYAHIYHDRAATRLEREAAQQRAAEALQRAAEALQCAEAERAAKETALRQAAAERAAKEAERAAKEALLAKLRALGIDPDSL